MFIIVKRTEVYSEEMFSSEVEVHEEIIVTEDREEVKYQKLFSRDETYLKVSVTVFEVDARLTVEKDVTFTMPIGYYGHCE